MARLIYSAIASLDGYVEDTAGAFDWSEPDDEVLAFVNDLERPIGTYLYGRRMYETLTYWETAGIDAGQTGPERDFARIWRALAAGLVDECQVFLGAIAVGGGKPVFPLGVRLRLELLDEHRFSGGTVYLRYAVLPAEKSTI
jgi:dihydrofolate reductase